MLKVHTIQLKKCMHAPMTQCRENERGSEMEQKNQKKKKRKK